MTKLEKAVDHILESDVALYTVMSIVGLSLLFLGAYYLFWRVR